MRPLMYIHTDLDEDHFSDSLIVHRMHLPIRLGQDYVATSWISDEAVRS